MSDPHRIEFRGQVEVLVADAPGVVCAQRHGYFVVADEDVGVVLGGLRGVGSGGYEGHRFEEVFEGEGALDGVAGAGPVGVAGEGVGQLGLGQAGDGVGLVATGGGGPGGGFFGRWFGGHGGSVTGIWVGRKTGCGG